MDTAAGAEDQPVSIDHILSVSHVVVSLLVGLVAATAVCVMIGSFEAFPLVAWNVGATVLLVLVWMVAWPQDSAGTREIAEREGRRSVTDTVVLSATFASFAAVIAGLIESSSRKDPLSVLIVVLTMTATLLSWATVNTIFALKYARVYYFDVDGGLDFKQDAPPTYVDFAYLAFTVGVSFAVSDTDVTSTEIRKLALFHALLSYAYTTLMVAVTINLVANI
jgi:uncharacterized membrane protein